MKKIYLAIGIMLSITAAQAQSNNVTGYVWQEKGIPDGIYDNITETMIPAIVVELYNYEGSEPVLVSAAITDQNGAYSLSNRETGTFYIQFRYPDKGLQATLLRIGADNNLNNSSDINGFTEEFTISDLDTDVDGYNLGLQNILNKRTFCTVKDAEIPTWNDTLKLPKSNTDLVGILTKVDIYAASLAYHPTISIENTAGGVSSANLSVGAQVTVKAPSLSTYSTLTSVNEVKSLPAYDGVTDFLGTSAFTWSDRYGVFVENTKVIVSNTPLNSYRGTDSISVAVNAESATTFIGGGSFEYSVSTFASAGVCVVYSYEAGVLPVTFLGFDASRLGGNAVLVKWTTTAEKDNKGFYVESSTNGVDFKELGFVAAKIIKNNTNGLNTYDFTDYAPNLSSNNFYRIKQVDFNTNKIVYTEVKKVSFNDGAKKDIQLFPNPVLNNKLNIINIAQYDNIVVFDYTGSIVLKENTNYQPSTSLNLNNLPKGNYILKASNSKNTDAVALPFIIK